MDQLTSVQYSEWEAYDRLDPLGSWREDFRLAYMSALITNLVISVHGKKGTKHTNPMDFMLDWDVTKVTEVKKQSPEDMKELLKSIAQGVNKKAVPKQVKKEKT